MGKNKRNNYKNKSQPASNTVSPIGVPAASNNNNNNNNNNGSNNNNNSNNNPKANVLQVKRKELPRFPTLSHRQRDDLNSLILGLSDLVFVQAITPAEEWEQYVKMHDLLKRIMEVEEPLRRIVCQPPGDATTRLAKVEAFNKWAADGGAKNQGLEIATFPGYQLGLRATRDLGENEVVLTLPREMIFSSESLPEAERKLFSDYTSLSNFCLAYALIVEKVRGSDSYWLPYIDLLPDSYNTVLYYDPPLMQRLKGTAAITAALRQCRAIARQYTNMYQCAYAKTKANSDKVSSAMGVFFKTYGLCYDLFRWAVSTVMTRQNQVPREDPDTQQMGPISVLIPYWDMANHRPGSISSFYTCNSREITCSTQEACAAGEQFFIYYGNRTNAELLVHNGFVDVDNKNDYVKICVGLSATDALAEKRARILSALNIDRKPDLRVMPGPIFISGELLAFVRVFTMNPDQLDHWCSNIQRVENLLYLDCALETEHERRTWLYLNQRLRLLLRVLQSTHPKPPEEMTEQERQEVDEMNKKRELPLVPQGHPGQSIEETIMQYRLLEIGILAGATMYTDDRLDV